MEPQLCKKVTQPNQAAQCVLSFSWCMKSHSLEMLVWKLDISVKQILDVTAI